LRHGGEVFDTEGPGVVGAQPGDDAGGAVALLSEGGNGAEMIALGTAEQSVDDLALDERGEEGDVLRSVEQIDEARAGAEELGGGDSDGHAARARGLGRDGQLVLTENAADFGHLETEEQAEDRLLRSGVDDLADHGQIDRGEEEV